MEKYKEEIAFFEPAWFMLTRIMSCYNFLLSVGNIDGYDLYETFYIKDDKGQQMEVSVNMNDDKESVSIDVEMGDLMLCVDRGSMSLIETTQYSVAVLFSVQNPQDIKTEEALFQAGTITDLSGIDSPEWFINIYNCYTQVAEMIETD